MLTPASKPSPGQLLVMSSAGLSTVPYATQFPGMCRSDVIFVNYAPVAQDGRPGSWTLRPYGLESSFIPHIDARSFRQEQDTDRSPFAGRCNALSVNDTKGWFGASDETTGAGGYAAMAALRKRLVAGSIKPAACEGIFPTTTCDKALSEAVDPDNLSQIVMCDAPADERCFKITSSSDTDLTIRVTNKKGKIDPESIKSVEIEQYIIIT